MQPGSYACRPERLCRPVHHFQEDTHYAVPCRQLCISPSCCASPILPAGGCVYSPHHPQHRQPVEDTARQPCQVPAQLTCRQAPHRLLAETRALMCFCAAPGRAAESVMHMLTSCLADDMQFTCRDACPNVRLHSAQPGSGVMRRHPSCLQGRHYGHAPAQHAAQKHSHAAFDHKIPCCCSLLRRAVW